MNRKQLLYYAIKYKGEYDSIRKAILNNEAYKKVETSQMYITLLDDLYPAQLKQLFNPPYVLFYEGDYNLIHTRLVSIVGSRIPCEYAVNQTKWIVDVLGDVTIVSGLAKGLDAVAHMCAIEDKRTIAVVGCGLNICYPYENYKLYEEIKKNHLMISEYPLDTRPLKHHFIMRNRIIAALSNSLIVVQAKMKSGTMITVEEALKLGKEVYSIPYHLDNMDGKGCNFLLQQGANFILSEEDIYEISINV